MIMVNEYNILKGGKIVLNVVNVPGFSRIDAVDIFYNEIEKLYSKNKQAKKEYLKFLNAELHKIDNRTNVINREEPIKYKGVTLYAIRKPMKKNTRILYYYMQNDRIVLLTVFDEKNDSDYDNAKKRAWSRLKLLEII